MARLPRELILVPVVDGPFREVWHARQHLYIVAVAHPLAGVFVEPGGGRVDLGGEIVAYELDAHAAESRSESSLLVSEGIAHQFRQRRVEV